MVSILLRGILLHLLKRQFYSFNDLSEQKNIKLVFHSEIKELDTLFDKDKLEKIIFNLLSNAFKFTPIDGEVSVTLFTDALVFLLKKMN